MHACLKERQRQGQEERGRTEGGEGQRDTKKQRHADRGGIEPSRRIAESRASPNGRRVLLPGGQLHLKQMKDAVYVPLGEGVPESPPAGIGEGWASETGGCWGRGPA